MIWLYMISSRRPWLPIRELFLTEMAIQTSGWLRLRGTLAIRSMVDAIPALTTDKAVKLFEAFGVFTKAELESRSEVEYENYSKAIAFTLRPGPLRDKSIMPAVASEYTQLLLPPYHPAVKA